MSGHENNINDIDIVTYLTAGTPSGMPQLDSPPIKKRRASTELIRSIGQCILGTATPSPSPPSDKTCEKPDDKKNNCRRTVCLLGQPPLCATVRYLSEKLYKTAHLALFPSLFSFFFSPYSSSHFLIHRRPPQTPTSSGFPYRHSLRTQSASAWCS